MSHRVQAVVVSFNSSAELPACLAALERSEGVELELHVVDNASHDGSAELVRERFPRAHLLAGAHNLGFGPANNLVLSRSDAPWVALVNPDAVVAPGAIAMACDALSADPTAVAAATRLVHPDGRAQPSCHGFPTLVNLVGEALGLEYLLPGSAFDSLHLRGFAHDRPRRVDWIQGAFLVLPRAVVRATGGFDPDYFMYGEEMDLLWRACPRGEGALFLPSPPVVHIGGASSSPLAGPMFVEVLKSRVRFFRKHRGPLATLLARLVTALATFLRWMIWEAAALVPASDPVVRARRALRVRMFRAALAWVGRGLPLSPPDLPDRGGIPAAGPS